MKLLFSRFVSLVQAGEVGIRARNSLSNLSFPGLFSWFEPGKERFVPGIFYEFFLFPVHLVDFAFQKIQCQKIQRQKIQHPIIPTPSNSNIQKNSTFFDLLVDIFFISDRIK